MAGLDLGGSKDIDFFNVMASKIRAIKSSWNATTASTVSSNTEVTTHGMGDFPMEPLDEDWLRNLFVPWQ